MRCALNIVVLPALVLVVALSLRASIATAAREGPWSVRIEVPVHTCAYDNTWIRPTEAEMESTIWRDNRYGGIEGWNRPLLRAYYQRSFFLYTTVTASGTGSMLNLSGLWTARPLGIDLCSDGEALREGREIVIWVIGHEVIAATIEGDELFVVAQPHESTDRGYHIVQVARPHPVMLRVRFVLPGGEELARADGTNLFGPVPPIRPSWATLPISPEVD